MQVTKLILLVTVLIAVADARKRCFPVPTQAPDPCPAGSCPDDELTQVLDIHYTPLNDVSTAGQLAYFRDKIARLEAKRDYYNSTPGFGTCVACTYLDSWINTANWQIAQLQGK